MRVEPRSTDYQDEPSIEFPNCTKIDEHTITITPRYSETDQAGVVHHTVYPVWFEMGRTELLRENGLAYSELEKAGVFFVVAELTAKYRRPCFYDEKLELTTTCSRITSARVEHSYQLKRASTGLILSEGSSILACVDKSGKPQRMPKFMSPGE
jgi:acyl-CoA thioester hydrolase